MYRPQCHSLDQEVTCKIRAPYLIQWWLNQPQPFKLKAFTVSGLVVQVSTATFVQHPLHCQAPLVFNFHMFWGLSRRLAFTSVCETATDVFPSHSYSNYFSGYLLVSVLSGPERPWERNKSKESDSVLRRFLTFSDFSTRFQKVTREGTVKVLRFRFLTFGFRLLEVKKWLVNPGWLADKNSGVLQLFFFVLILL